MNAVTEVLGRLLNRLPSPVPPRQNDLAGQHALVDGIPYTMPVNSDDSPVLMAAFPISRAAAAKLLPGKELHPVGIGWGRGLLVVTVVNYLKTDIGKYIEYSLAIAVTHGRHPAPPILPGLFMKNYGTGQYVVDLPVSSEVSVKGGKGIWGMPKHQANLDFVVSEKKVSAIYEQNGQHGCTIDIKRPPHMALPLKLAAVNYCAFRGQLMKSSIYFEAEADVAIGPAAKARLVFGDVPAVAPLKTLHVGRRPLFTAYMPKAHGVLDDHYEGWFLTADTSELAASEHRGDGLGSVAHLTNSQEWLKAPQREAPGARATEVEM
ncbi:acetoacetate decarboxylase family protein [Cryobacterium sp. MLB-32]|uniref:acetoacetate decarboxylase family protein n=1 Tax=Cryobacterium sp. MLB-32 TaxID=1529318 RepID=UPI0009E02D3E|nr:acetoacetate decarboxylase family protein [Cryobacterium sp. MLB-32]